MSDPRKGVCEGNTYKDVTWHSHGGVKRFVVFAYERYYPSGGFGDGRADFDTREEAEAYANTLQESCAFDYVEAVDLLDTPPWRLSKGKDVRQ